MLSRSAVSAKRGPRIDTSAVLRVGNSAGYPGRVTSKVLLGHSLALWTDNQLERDLVRPFGRSEVENRFAAGVSEVPRTARDGAGALRAWDVDKDFLGRDVTLWQRSYDRAAEAGGGWVNERASPVRPPDLGGRVACEEYIVREDVKVSRARRCRADVDEVVNCSGPGDDVNPHGLDAVPGGGLAAAMGAVTDAAVRASPKPRATAPPAISSRERIFPPRNEICQPGGPVLAGRSSR